VDLDLGTESGLDVIPALCASAGVASVIAMSSHASIAWAVEAMRRGAFEFLEKPFAVERLVEVLARAVERSRLVRENERLRAIVSTSPGSAPVVPPELFGAAMRQVYATVARAAKLDVPILIVGETGTGKEFVARRSTPTRRGARGRGSRSTAAGSSETSSTARSSATRRAPSREPGSSASGSSRSRAGARSSSTRWASSRPRRR